MATNNSLNNNSVSDFSSANFLAGYTTTTTAAGTTTLTVTSNQLQYFTGTTTQTVVLPVTSTLVLGQSFTITNNSTGVVTVQSSGANSIQAMAASTVLVVTCILTSGTTAASWSTRYNTQTASTTTNISGGAANEIVYQTATGVTGFLTAANSSVLTTNGSGVPSLTTTVLAANVPIDATTITSNGSVISASGTFSGGLITAPVSSNTATTAYGTSLTAGTALRNTNGYDLLVNICATVTAATSSTFVLGVGSTSTPTTNTVVPSFTVAATTQYSFSAIVPNNYYLLVNDTGTITLSSLTIQACPL
jgi:hypothetical protein